MLVAFYQDRAAPVRNGLRVWAVYRMSDAALLLASVAMHHLHGHGDFDKFLGIIRSTLHDLRREASSAR